jgi:hypothetical protein
VTDFQAGAPGLPGDKLDFSAIDPRAGGVDDAFVFIGARDFALGEFQGGQIRATQIGGNTLVQLEFTGDGIADMEVELLGLYTLRQDAMVQDFIL